MSRSLRRGALAATAIVLSIASLSACGAGNDAQTLEVRPDNAAVTVDDVKIQNAAVITQPKGAEGPAVVSATIFNNGHEEQKLESITLPGSSGTVKLTGVKGSSGITVPANGSVVLGGKGNPTAVIANGREATKDGDVQDVVFKLSKTGDVKIQALVVSATGYFKNYGPAEVPAPPAGGPEEKPSSSATGEPADGAHGEGEQSDKPAGGATAPSDGASASHSAAGH